MGARGSPYESTFAGHGGYGASWGQEAKSSCGIEIVAAFLGSSAVDIGAEFMGHEPRLHGGVEVRGGKGR